MRPASVAKSSPTSTRANASGSLTRSAGASIATTVAAGAGAGAGLLQTEVEVKRAEAVLSAISATQVCVCVHVHACCTVHTCSSTWRSSLAHSLCFGHGKVIEFGGDFPVQTLIVVNCCLQHATVAPSHCHCR